MSNTTDFEKGSGVTKLDTETEKNQPFKWKEEVLTWSVFTSPEAYKSCTIIQTIIANIRSNV